MKNTRYDSDIDSILEFLRKDASDPELLLRTQDRIDALAQEYQHDESLGADRYKLYEAQALIHYRNGADSLAVQWMREAISVRGESYKFAEHFLESVKASDSGPQSETPEQRRKRISDHYTRIGGAFGIVLGIYGSKLLPVSNVLITVVAAIIVGALCTWLASVITTAVLDNEGR